MLVCNLQPVWPLTAAHVGEAGEQQREEEVEDDEVAHEDGGHEVGYARLAAHEDAVPHGLYPLPAQHTEHNHETVTEETLEHSPVWLSGSDYNI